MLQRLCLFDVHLYYLRPAAFELNYLCVLLTSQYQLYLNLFKLRKAKDVKRVMFLMVVELQFQKLAKL